MLKPEARQLHRHGNVSKMQHIIVQLHFQTDWFDCERRLQTSEILDNERYEKDSTGTFLHYCCLTRT
jgi:hypothetical protein